MSCMCGAVDCPSCGKSQGYDQPFQDLEEEEDDIHELTYAHLHEECDCFNEEDDFAEDAGLDSAMGVI